MQDNQEIVARLIDKDIATLLSLAILAFSVAMMLGFTYLIIRVWKGNGNNKGIDPITKLFAKFIDKLDNVDSSVSNQEDVMKALITSIETGDQTKIEQHNQFLFMAQKITQGIDETKQVVSQMKDDLTGLIQELLEKLTSGIEATLSLETKKELVSEVSELVSVNVTDKIADMEERITTLLTDKLKHITQETPKVEQKPDEQSSQSKGRIT